MCLMHPTAEMDPSQGSPLSTWMGKATEKDWPKRLSDHQLQEVRKKTLIVPWLLWWRQSVSLHIWRCQGARKPSSCATFTSALSCHRWRKALRLRTQVASVVSSSLCPCGLWPARLLCRGGFSRHWSMLANTGYHTCPEHYISCFLSCQLPWVAGAARTPETQAAAPPPHLAFTVPKSSRALSGANPSEWLTYRYRNNSTIETQGQCD